jgi:acyl carrier protein
MGLTASATGADTELAKELRALDSSARRARVGRLVHEHVAAVLGWSSTNTPDARRGFFDLGMDSLMALDLKNRLQDSLGLPLRATVVFNYSTIDALADFLAAQFGSSSPATTSTPTSSSQPVTAVAIDTLSDDEALRLLDEQLAAMEPSASERADHE